MIFECRGERLAAVEGWDRRRCPHRYRIRCKIRHDGHTLSDRAADPHHCHTSLRTIAAHRMFTGLIEATGTIEHIEPRGNGKEFFLETPFTAELSVGDSLAVDGVCLTVVSTANALVLLQAVEETLSKTALGERSAGDMVNLERAMLPSARMGGHIVQGHVDCMATVSSITPLSLSHEVRFRFPREFHSLVVPTGSICINGISLTVARVDEGGAVGDESQVALPDFMVAIIPHTWDVTTMHRLHEGDNVNVEFDIVGKYVRRSIEAWQAVVRS